MYIMVSSQFVLRSFVGYFVISFAYFFHCFLVRSIVSIHTYQMESLNQQHSLQLPVTYRSPGQHLIRQSNNCIQLFIVWFLCFKLHFKIIITQALQSNIKLAT